jgi:hypothetical protein
MNSKKNSGGKKGQITSFILMWIITSTFLVIVVPMNTQRVSGQVTHLGSCAAEDAAGLPYDIGPVGDGEVIWDPNEDHIITTNYLIEEDMTLNIPPLNYFMGEPEEHEISIVCNSFPFWIDVYGRLITNSDGNWLTKTFFNGTGLYPYFGIRFNSGSEGRIYDSRITRALSGVVFLPGSKLISPGISESAFVDNINFGLKMDGALGYTNVTDTYFDDREPPQHSILMAISNGYLNLSDTQFLSHYAKHPAVNITNSTVYFSDSSFYNENKIGHSIFIQGDSNKTVLDHCYFMDGAVDNYYIRSEGVSFSIENCSFHTSDGAMSVIAADNKTTGVPSHVSIRNPTADGWPGFYDDTFDNSTVSATGNSSVSLKWFQNVYVEDPDGNPIENSAVLVKDRNGDPAEPSVKMSDTSGWAKWISCTELVKYESITTYFNPFNVSASNNSMMAYLNPQIDMTMSKESSIVVPFNPTPNSPPWISLIQTPSGIQSGPTSIQFMLEDTDVGDDGNISVIVEFWDPDALVWKPATAHSTSDPTDLLKSNHLYTFVWASNAPDDYPAKYSTEIKIRITPFDRIQQGTSDETGVFTVDNLLPELVSGPVVSALSDTSATIEWTMNQECTASVWYGLDGVKEHETIGNSGSVSQVVTLTGLSPGRVYTYFINSSDPEGNKYSSDPVTYIFETKIHMQLLEGWNLISIAPFIQDPSIENVLDSINGKYNAVQWYNAQDPTDPWKHYVPGKPFGNDLAEIFPEMGLWIHMTEDAILVHDNIVPPKSHPPFQTLLVEGWNMVGYPSVTTRTVDEALGTVNYDLVKTYDPETGIWLTWTGDFGNLVNMELGWGYWIYVSSVQMWNVTYT